MTTENSSAADTAGTETNTNENPGEKTLGFSSMEQPKENQSPSTESAASETGKAPSEESGKNKPEEDKPANEENPESPAEVDYSDVKAPNGFEVDKEVMEQIKPILKELNCSKENAEKLVAAGSELVKRTLEAQQAAVEAEHQKWREEVLADKELGKDENIAIANRAIETFGDEGFKEIIRAGLGNHPAMVRFCYNIGKAISEDSAVISTGSAKASNRNELGEPMLHFQNM